MQSRNLGSVYLAPSFTYKWCTAAEETMMLKLTLILAVLGVPIGISTLDASSNHRCPEHCPEHHYQCSRPFDHDGANHCPHGNGHSF
jgi:hypothetical protein